MTDQDTAPGVIGIGVACGFGYGKASLSQGLFSAGNVFSVLHRPGRDADAGFIGVELPEPPAILSPRVARTTTLSGRVAIAVLDEAWRDAGLDDVDPERIGLVVGGSNLLSREQAIATESYAGRLAYLPPRFGHLFLDTDVGATCSAHFLIRGPVQTVGAASASGVVATLSALEMVRSGRADVVIALGALQDLSHWDLLGMRATGAMGSGRFAQYPGQACRPMDQDHDGFIYGESCAALVIASNALQKPIYAHLLGGAQVADGNRGPEPDSAGQQRAIRLALDQAGLRPDDIDYVNPHATGTPLGDNTELQTLRAAGLQHARINASKSLLGHGLSAAGATELACVMLQMRAGRLHPTRNLINPLDEHLHWVQAESVPHRIRYALKLSYGFGGINTAMVLAAPDGVAK
ncbi:MAG: beta-ketoacyl synthase N-terminal-like domain-containing protein [Pseudomonadota bacterium]